MPISGFSTKLKGFTKAPDAKGDFISATVTFPAEGGTRVGGKTDPDARIVRAGFQ